MAETARPSASHRLLVSAERWARLRHLPEVPVLKRSADTMDALAARWADDRTITLDETSHNWHLIRARTVQTRVVTLLVQYGRTGNRRFRDAAMAYLRDMAEWEYWSWLAWRDRNPDPNAIFDLSYGENAMTLALAWDWLAGELTAEERDLLIGVARKRALAPYIAHTATPGKEAWFYRKPDTNWNTVCNGGAGLLALAMGEVCPESAQVIELAEEGMRHYFESMADDGAWPEGIGYWGYGHRYGYFYLLSRERVTGKPHPLLERSGSRNTLRFPLLFSPNGVPTSFGDVNDFFPLPFHYAAAQRYGMGDIVAELDRRFGRLAEKDPESLNASGPWPGLAELFLFHPGQEGSSGAECSWPRVSIQRGLEWSCLADEWPEPKLYASVRGGTTDAPHTHQDLMSLFVVVGREPLVRNVGVEDYIDTTFSPRRFELYEMSAASKNSFMVNGVGMPQPAKVKTMQVEGPGWEGILLDGTDAMSVGAKVLAYGRAVLMLQKAAILVLDRVVLEHAGLAESRFHTYAKVRCQKKSVTIQGKESSLHLAFAASVPAVLKRGMGCPVDPPVPPDEILRWMTPGKHHEVTLATLMTPHSTGRVTVKSHGLVIRTSGPGYDVTLGFSGRETLSLETLK